MADLEAMSSSELKRIGLYCSPPEPKWPREVVLAKTRQAIAKTLGGADELQHLWS